MDIIHQRSYNDFLDSPNIPDNFSTFFQAAMKVTYLDHCLKKNGLGFYKHKNDAAVVVMMTLQALGHCVDETTAKKITADKYLLGQLIKDMDRKVETTRRCGWDHPQFLNNEISRLTLEPRPTVENIRLYEQLYTAFPATKERVDALVEIMKENMPTVEEARVYSDYYADLKFKERFGITLSEYRATQTASLPTSTSHKPSAQTSGEKVIQNTQTQDKIKQFNDMVGLDRPKNTINNIIRTNILNRMRMGNDQDDQPMHMAFVGNPGTGKTETARYLAYVLYEAGIIPENKIIEKKASDLIGEYIGHTAPKVTNACAEAYGGVLFIDEAYIWAEIKDFGPEAATQLLQHMENDRGKFITVLAGYPEDMDRLIKMNPGFKSRIPYMVDFPDYTVEDMAKIMQKMAAAKGLTVERDALAIAMKHIEYLKTIAPNDFSNARDVRNTLQGMMDAQSARIFSEHGDSIIESVKLAKEFRQKGAAQHDNSIRIITKADAESYVISKADRRNVQRTISP